jgi:hypothetical protein
MSVAAGSPEPGGPRAIACPLTGRLGLWTATREARPRPRPTRQPHHTPVEACPFCDPADDDPRLLGDEVDGAGGRWFGLRNIYPPLEGPTGRAVLAVAAAHSPSLAHRRSDLAAAWAGQLALQLRLASRLPDRWSLLTTAIGITAGASQQHPHGQVLTPSVPPPAVVAMQQRLERRAVVDALLTAAHRVEERDGVHLVAPPVPLGPADLLLVPARPSRASQLPVEAVAGLIASWLVRVHELLEIPATAWDAPSPLDVKTLLYDALPDGTGRWVVELMVTDRHAPGVAAAPLVDLVRPPARHADWFRSAGRSA